MRTTLIAAALAAALAAPATAHPLVSCVTSVFNIVCLPNATAPDARIITMPEYVDPDVTPADRASWAERCKPRKVFDGLSVRWVYAERGCDVGPMHLE